MQNENSSRDLARQAGFAKWKAHIHSPDEIRKRFWAKVTVLGRDDCWIWNGALNERGYGSLTHKMRRWKAHRFAFFLTHGEFDFALDVLHECDNPPCCNPNHLELGTHEENMQQMVARGRWGTRVMASGEHHGMSKLNIDNVREIRLLESQGITNRDIAIRFGVTEQNVRRIVMRETWRHV